MAQDNPPVGALFRVFDVEEFRDSDGNLIARWLPEMSPYRVTLKNAEAVGDLIASGHALVVGIGRGRQPAGVVQVG